MHLYGYCIAPETWYHVPTLLLIPSQSRSRSGDTTQHTAHPQNLRVCHHGRVGPRNVEVALVELPEAAAVHLRVVPSVHFADVVALDVPNAVERHIPCEWHCQIIPASQ